MSLRDKLKQRKPKEITITLDDDQYLVRFPGRVAKNQAFAKATIKDELNPSLLESQLLAVCVLDPATFDPVMPDPADWDLSADVGPLVRAVIDVCGLDKDDTKAMGKDLGENAS